MITGKRQPPSGTMSAPRTLRAGAHVLNLSKPIAMGVLNVTPDSFSDGGLFLDPARAEEHAARLEAEGAALLDLGAESSRPGARAVTADDEMSRLVPALRRILRQAKIPVSVDTCKYEVMERVLDMGVSMINDIDGVHLDDRISRLIAGSGAALCVMHMRGTPQTMQNDTVYGNLLGEVEDGLSAACRAALEGGISPDRLVVDPGIGFGKSPEGNCALIAGIGHLKEALGFPVLAGISRKSFLSKIADTRGGDIRAVQAAAHAAAVLAGADILRVHDVRDALQAIDAASAILRQKRDV